jgi:ankyrin repeat protein
MTGCELAKLNLSSQSALIISAASGNEQITQYLLQHGQNIGYQDRSGQTAQVTAEKNGHLKITELSSITV